MTDEVEVSTEIGLTMEETLMNRVKRLEASQEKFLNTLQSSVNTLNDLRQRFENVQVIISAMMRTVADARTFDSTNLRESHHLVTSERVHVMFNKAVENGMLLSVDEVADDSFVLCQEFNASGVELHRASEFSIAELEPDQKVLFLGKKIGEKVALFKDGQLARTFVLTSIFKPVETITKEFQTDVQL